MEIEITSISGTGVIEEISLHTRSNTGAVLGHDERVTSGNPTDPYNQNLYVGKRILLKTTPAKYIAASYTSIQSRLYVSCDVSSGKSLDCTFKIHTHQIKLVDDPYA
jgi:hypothetical protein